jgi:hypothetical protein
MAPSMVSSLHFEYCTICFIIRKTESVFTPSGTGTKVVIRSGDLNNSSILCARKCIYVKCSRLGLVPSGPFESRAAGMAAFKKSMAEDGSAESSSIDKLSIHSALRIQAIVMTYFLALCASSQYNNLQGDLGPVLWIFVCCCLLWYSNMSHYLAASGDVVRPAIYYWERDGESDEAKAIIVKAFVRGGSGGRLDLSPR